MPDDVVLARQRGPMGRGDYRRVEEGLEEPSFVIKLLDTGVVHEGLSGLTYAQQLVDIKQKLRLNDVQTDAIANWVAKSVVHWKSLLPKSWYMVKKIVNPRSGADMTKHMCCRCREESWPNLPADVTPEVVTANKPLSILSGEDENEREEREDMMRCRGCKQPRFKEGTGSKEVLPTTLPYVNMGVLAQV